MLRMTWWFDVHIDPLTPWPRRIVLQTIKKLKAEAEGQDVFHLVGPAIPNSKRPKAEHHWLPSNLIVAKAPWSESLEVPKNILWMGQGRTSDIQPWRRRCVKAHLRDRPRQ